METTVNERIMLLQKQLNLTDIEFSVKAEISTGTLFRIKKGEPVSSKVLKSISDGTRTELHWLKTGKGKTMMEVVEPITENPWKDALVVELKEKNSFLEKQAVWMQNLINNLTQTGVKASFNIASDVAEIPYYLLSGVYSGANAQC